jgi:hypothetical protein
MANGSPPRRTPVFWVRLSSVEETHVNILDAMQAMARSRTAT